MAFSLRDSIANDYLIFDNIFDGSIIHNVKEARPDFTTGKINHSTVETPVSGCLFRDLAVRNNQSLKQIRAPNASIGNDVFYTSDLVVEIPQLDGLLVDEGDTFIDTRDNKSYNIVAVDLVTLTTRIRIALRYFH